MDVVQPEAGPGKGVLQTGDGSEVDADRAEAVLQAVAELANRYSRTGVRGGTRGRPLLWTVRPRLECRIWGKATEVGQWSTLTHPPPSKLSSVCLSCLPRPSQFVFSFVSALYNLTCKLNWIVLWILQNHTIQLTYRFMETI